MPLDSLFFHHAQVCIDLAVISSHNESLTSSLGPRHAIQQSLDLDLGCGNAMECLFAQEEFIGAKSLALPSVLANICRPVMGTVSVLSFGKVGENRKKKWRKYGEYLWSILVLPSFCRVSQCGWWSCHHLVSRQASGEDCLPMGEAGHLRPLS